MMNLVAENTVQDNNWRISREGNFSADELINAFLQGKEEGKNELKRAIKKLFETNLNTAQSIGAGFVDSINENSPVVPKAFLKTEGLNSYKLMVVLKNEFYYKTADVKPIYKKAFQVEKENRSRDFSIEISFLPESKEINEHRLFTDGYIFDYNGKL